jgi:hypothetical protein
VDLDGDRQLDIISGSWPEKVFIFRGLASGLFAPATPILGVDGQPLEVPYGSSISAADWDGDGQLDLLIGGHDGTVHWARNAGTAIFENPQPVFAAGQQISCGRDAAPVVVDWDGDGNLDLLLGTGEGSVVWYRNEGTRSPPELSGPQVLIPAPEENDLRGTSAKICVTDWNGNGRLDIVLGDAGDVFDKELSDEEADWCDLARAQQADLLKQWTAVFQEYRRVLCDADSGKEPASARLDELRQHLEMLHEAREKAFHQAAGLTSGKQRHGRLWLFLRRE